METEFIYMRNKFTSLYNVILNEFAYSNSKIHSWIHMVRKKVNLYHMGREGRRMECWVN